MTPSAIHYGEDRVIYERRRDVLLTAYSTHPERFVRRPPQPPSLPEAVWINPPASSPPAEAAPDVPADSAGKPVPDSSTCDAAEEVRAGPLPGPTDFSVTDVDVVVTSTEREGELCHAQ